MISVVDLLNDSFKEDRKRRTNCGCGSLNTAIAQSYSILSCFVACFCLLLLSTKPKQKARSLQVMKIVRLCSRCNDQA